MRLRPGCWFETRPPRLLPWAWLLLALAAATLRADSPGGGGDLGPAPRVRAASVTVLSTMLADTEGLGYTSLQTPLKRITRRPTIHWPPSAFQVIPDCFSRWVNTVLHAASVTPLPIGKWSRR
jgi:hypothetical protein